MERPFLGPEHEKRTLYFLLQVRCVVCQIDGGCRPVIFTQSPDRGGIAEATQIFVISWLTHPLRDVFARLFASKSEQHRLQKNLGAIGEHRFGEWRRLNKQEPVEKDRGELLGH